MKTVQITYRDLYELLSGEDVVFRTDHAGPSATVMLSVSTISTNAIESLLSLVARRESNGVSERIEIMLVGNASDAEDNQVLVESSLDPELLVDTLEYCAKRVREKML